jgi:hypothetical protein
MRKREGLTQIKNSNGALAKFNPAPRCLQGSGEPVRCFNPAGGTSLRRGGITPDARTARTIDVRQRLMAINKTTGKQNVTLRLDRETFRKAKTLVARRSISLSELVARRIEVIFGEEESYERSEWQARELLERGFHLGGGMQVERDELHVRKTPKM